MFYTLTELIFICLYSAILALVFGDLFTSSLECTSWTPYRRYNLPPPTTVGNAAVDGTVASSICQQQIAQVVVVFLSVIFYVTVLVISLWRIFAKVSRRCVVRATFCVVLFRPPGRSSCSHPRARQDLRRDTSSRLHSSAIQRVRTSHTLYSRFLAAPVTVSTTRNLHTWFQPLCPLLRTDDSLPACDLRPAPGCRMASSVCRDALEASRRAARAPPRQPPPLFISRARVFDSFALIH